MNDPTIIILAAGLGTRMRSRKAKVLHEAGGLPLIEHVVRSASALTSADRIVVVVGHQAEQVESLLAGRGFLFARQTEQKGTGHAVAACASAVPDRAGRVMIVYGDGPLLSAATLRRLAAHHEAADAAATVIAAELENPTGYGRVLMEDGYIRGIVEEKAATPEEKAVRLINSGLYCFEGALMWECLERLEPNPASGEYYLTDVVEMLHGAGKRVSALVHEDASELLGINTRVELAEVDRIFRARKTRELMLSGVTIENPDSVMIDTDVQVGVDTVIESHVRVLGQTVIGSECRIGAGTVLSNCRVGDSVVIAPYTIANTSDIDEGATVGPFAQLRLENHVGAGAHIGNFVELKKAHLGAGSKASHLTYLGDSEIGVGVNIGAGTITCNYDGKKKHRTLIGDRAFVGSNSTLVAPVNVGEGAYVAAGSVITDPVPDNALGIARGRQMNKEGWAKKRRETP